MRVQKSFRGVLYLLLLLEFSTHCFFTSEALADRFANSVIPSECQSFLKSFTKSPFLSEQGQEILLRFQHLRKGVPLRLGQFLDAHQDHSLPESIMDIMHLRWHMAKELLQLTKDVENEPILTSILIKGAQSLSPTDNQMKSAERYRHKYANLYWHKMSLEEKMEVKKYVRNLFNPLRTQLDEVAVAFQVPGLVSINQPVRNTLPERLQENESQYLPPGLSDKELDVIFKDGRAWGEVKSSKAGWGSRDVANSLIKQAKKMRQAAKVIAHYRKHPIEIHYFFIGEKPPRHIQCLFRNWGLRMHWAPDANYLSSPIHLLPQNCKAAS